jgi:hypothetical protein
MRGAYIPVTGPPALQVTPGKAPQLVEFEQMDGQSICAGFSLTRAVPGVGQEECHESLVSRR